MKTGVFTVSMPEYSPKEAVRILKELGYDGVEWRVARVPEEKKENIAYEDRYWQDNKCTLDIEKIEETAESVRQMCDAYQISVFGLTTYLKPHEHRRIESVLRAAAIMGCSQVRVFTPDYDETRNCEELFCETRKNVEILEALARKYQVKIVFEIWCMRGMKTTENHLRCWEISLPIYILKTEGWNQAEQTRTGYSSGREHGRR